MRIRKNRRSSVVLILVFVALAAGIIFVATLYYRHYKQTYRRQMEGQLSAIADLKVSELAQWRKERLGDAALFYKNVVFSAWVRRYFEQPENPETQKELRTWMSHVQAAFQYDRVMLLDVLYSKKLSVPDGPERSPSFVSSSSSEDLRSGKVVFEDFYWNEENRRIYLKVLVPILDEAQRDRVLGILALRIDPETFLYPLINHWPILSQTAETLLVRREGKDALFLTPLRYQQAAALHLRVPLGREDMPAVKAVLGQEGIVEGVDYRGAPVVSALRRIPDSPWFLVARMDASEVFGPMKARLGEIVVLAAVLLLGMGAVLGYFWRRQSIRLYRERYQASEALRESEERFRVLFESSHDAIMTLEPPSWNFTSGNPATVAMFGARDAQDFMTRGPGNLSPERQPDGRSSPEKAKEMIETAMREGSCFFEWTHMRTDGTKFSAAVLLTRMEYTGKSFLQATVRDITEQKRAEEELRFRNVILSTQQEMSPDGIHVVDPEGKMISWNQRFIDMWGIPSNVLEARSSELALKSILGKLAAPEQFLAEVRRLYDDTRATAHDELVLRDGRVFDRHSAPMIGEDGGYHGRVWYFRDITKQKRAAEALQDSESRLNAIMDSAQDAILMMNPEGKVTFWNPAAERLFGYNRTETLGRNLHDLIAPQRFHDAHHAAFPGFLRTGQGAAVGKTLELQALRKDGREITIELSLSAVWINSGWHAVGILRDVTEQKRAEEDLRETNRNLEQAKERANQLAVEAQAANIAKGQFLANMSHEIRTPMNGVIGMTGLLMATDLSEEQRRFAESVRSSGEALLSVINDILDFSKIEADKLDLEELDFDLRATLEDAAELLSLRAQEKNLEFIYRIDPAVRTFLRGDPGRLRQILINLGNNAIKFTSRGEVAVEVRLESETDGQIKIRFEVRDTGIGIPEDKIGLLFSAFQQVDSSTTRRFGGTGLGLAISKRLTERMGGDIGVASLEGRGSTFWFTAVFGKQIRSERPDRSLPADLHGVRILAVDDNAMNRLVIAEQLSAWGVRHVEAESAARAIELLHAARVEGDAFRIVITDMQMPETDGESLGRAIKADPALRGTDLVMMSSFGKRGDAKRLQDIGFSAYLTKPIKQSQLFDCLATVVGRSETPAPTPANALITRHTLHEARRNNIRILLAEDNVTNRQVALGVLANLGFKADIAADGRDVLQALKTIPYDIVLMDVQMPEMDGFEATGAIRSGTSGALNPRIPIIAMTAHAMKGDRERCLEAGMDDYISKPIVPQALAEALEKWVDKAQELRSGGLAPRAEIRPPADPLVFDRQALSDRLMGDADLVKQIIAIFLEDMPRQLQALKGHLDRRDAGSAGKQAHAIKGAAANVGGMALSAVAAEMEKAGDLGRTDEIAALLPELMRQFDHLRMKMEEETP